MPIADLPFRRWLNVAVPVGVTMLLLALLFPAVQQAREAARRTQIRNSLHNFGLALHNYHDTHDCFPPGGVIGADGTAYHGWYVMLAPYMDASPLYSRIDPHRPWDDPANDWLFLTPINWCLSPAVAETETSEGYALTHFDANPHLLHRNSSVTLDDLTHGLPHTWCLGEAGGEFTPYAYPFNWRPLGTRLNADPGGFGLPGRDGTFLLMADGSVPWWSSDTSPQALQALAAAPPVPEPGEVAVPPRPARYRYSGRREQVLKLAAGDRDVLCARSLIEADGTPARVSLESLTKFQPPPATLDDLRRTAAAFPAMRRLTGVPVITDDTAGVLASLSSLVQLEAEGIDLSERGIQRLAEPKTLRFLTLQSADSAAVERLREALLDCTVTVGEFAPSR